jgi:hypothetical protein
MRRSEVKIGVLVAVILLAGVVAFFVLGGSTDEPTISDAGPGADQNGVRVTPQGDGTSAVQFDVGMAPLWDDDEQDPANAQGQGSGDRPSARPTRPGDPGLDPDLDPQIDPESMDSGEGEEVDDRVEYPFTEFEATFNGTVRDMHGLPVEGAEIYALVMNLPPNRLVQSVRGAAGTVRATTNAAGEYAFSVMLKEFEPAGMMYVRVHARKTGYNHSDSMTFEGISVESSDHTADFELQNMARLHGRVVDWRGNAVPELVIVVSEVPRARSDSGAPVPSANLSRDAHIATTNESGHFEVLVPLSMNAYTLDIRDTNEWMVADKPQNIEVSEPMDVWFMTDLVLAPPTTFRFTVVNDSGEPLASAAVRVRFLDSEGELVGVVTAICNREGEAFVAKVPGDVDRQRDITTFELTATGFEVSDEYAVSLTVHTENQGPRVIMRRG